MPSKGREVVGNLPLSLDLKKLEKTSTKEMA